MKSFSAFRQSLAEALPAHNYIRATDKLPPLYAQDGKGDSAVAYVKLFNPMGDGTWFITEYDPASREAFGLTYMHGDSELGYVSIPELESIRVRGVRIERDLHFRPMTLGQIRSKRGVV